MTDFETSDRDVNRAIWSWLHEDRHEDASRLAGAVLDQVEATPQRRAIWRPARRTPVMNKIVTIGLGAAAVVVALLVGTQLLGSPSGGVGSGPSPTATLEPAATPEPTPTPTQEGLLPQGPHVLTKGGPDRSVGEPGRMTVTIPAPDWYGGTGSPLTKNDSPDAPDGAGVIVFGGPLHVYGDPCGWSTTRPDTPATTVDELVAALAGQASRDASEPVDITLDGYAGKAITLHVPDDAVFSECDGDTFGSWGVPGTDTAPYRYHQDPGQTDEVWVLDVDGELTTIDWTYYEGTPQVVVDELRAIVESITFGE